MPPADEAKEEADRLWSAVAFRGAVEKGEIELVEELLANGANPTYKMTDGASWTVLMLAGYSGHAALVEKLSKGGRMPKIDEKDPQGFQAIMLAAFKGHAAICQALLDKKADVNAKNEDGITPLMMAAGEGHHEVVSVLLANGADPDTLDKNDMSAIKKAARWGHLACLKELLPKVQQDPRQMKHCLLFGRLYGHEAIVAQMKKILEPTDWAAIADEAEALAVPEIRALMEKHGLDPEQCNDKAELINRIAENIEGASGALES